MVDLAVRRSWGAGWAATAHIAATILSLAACASAQGVRLHHPEPQPIPPFWTTAVEFADTHHDQYALRIPGTSRIEVSAAGDWLVGLHLDFEAEPAGQRAAQIRVYRDGEVVFSLSDNEVANDHMATVVSLTDCLPLEAGDVLEARAFQNSGRDLRIESWGEPHQSPVFWARRLSP